MKHTPANGGSNRMLTLAIIIVSVFAVFLVSLFRIQIVKGDYYAEKADKSTATLINVSASRGEILDRNSIPIAANRTTYAIMLDYNYFPTGTSDESP